MTTRERLINEGVIRPSRRSEKRLALVEHGQKRALAELKKRPQQAHVPPGGEYDPERLTNADRKLSGTGEGERFDDNIIHNH